MQLGKITVCVVTPQHSVVTIGTDNRGVIILVNLFQSVNVLMPLMSEREASDFLVWFTDSNAIYLERHNISDSVKNNGLILIVWQSNNLLLRHSIQCLTLLENKNKELEITGTQLITESFEGPEKVKNYPNKIIS